MRPPPASLARTLTAPCGSGVGRLYRSRVFCLQAGRRDAARRFLAEASDDRASTASRSTRAGSTRPAQAAMAADVAARRRGGAVLRAADPLGQADERADDLGRPLRLVHRRARATATSTATRPARPGRRSRRRVLAVWRDAGLARRAIPTAASSTTTAATARMGLHRDADEADFSWPVLSISLGDPGALPHGRRRRARTRPPRSCSRAATSCVFGGAGAARLPRHRPHPLRRLAPAARGRPDQPDLPRGRLRSTGTMSKGTSRARIRASDD